MGQPFLLIVLRTDMSACDPWLDAHIETRTLRSSLNECGVCLRWNSTVSVKTTFTLKYNR